jgi:hypothetical protein
MLDDRKRVVNAIYDSLKKGNTVPMRFVFMNQNPDDIVITNLNIPSKLSKDLISIGQENSIEITRYKEDEKIYSLSVPKDSYEKFFELITNEHSQQRENNTQHLHTR